MPLKYDIHDTLTAAIMNSKPFLVVEGKDDYQIYTALKSAYNPNIDVYQVAEFQDFSAGCKGVIDFIEKIQPQLDNDIRTKTKVLGIIDRDSRQYRGTIPDLQGLFILKYYAIETYFATKSNLKKLIAHISYIPHTDIPDAVIDSILQKFEATSNDLYYISLEALKNACDTDYTAVIGYDANEQVILNTQLMAQITPKKAGLEAFAQSKNVTQADLKLIAKAKWYLFAFVYHSSQIIKGIKDHPSIKGLNSDCVNNQIQQCRSCKVGNIDDCLYKVKNTYKVEILYNTIQTYIDEAECSDIIDAIRFLN